MLQQLAPLSLAFLITLGGASAGARERLDAEQHELAARREEARAQAEKARAEAAVERERCAGANAALPLEPGAGTEPCWTEPAPKAELHARRAAAAERRAVAHRIAAATQRRTAVEACVGIEPQQADAGPFVRTGDIAAVQPLRDRPANPRSPQRPLRGALVTIRAREGLTAEWLQRLVDCHLARSEALATEAADAGDCPLVTGVTRARVISTGDGFAVAITASDREVAAQILARAERLVAKQ